MGAEYKRWAVSVVRDRDERSSMSVGFVSARSQEEAIGMAIRESEQALASQGNDEANHPVALVAAWRDE